MQTFGGLQYRSAEIDPSRTWVALTGNSSDSTSSASAAVARLSNRKPLRPLPSGAGPPPLVAAKCSSQAMRTAVVTHSRRSAYLRPTNWFFELFHEGSCNRVKHAQLSSGAAEQIAMAAVTTVAGNTRPRRYTCGWALRVMHVVQHDCSSFDSAAQQRCLEDLSKS